VGGKEGLEAIIPLLGKVDLGVIGEPTGMQMAVAERGLMVLDCVAHGVSGHAAREEGVNAIYKALEDIEWFRNYRFPEESGFIGPVKMTVTMINAGTQHNVVPDMCKFVVDVRSNGIYDNLQILEVIRQNVKCEFAPRSTRLNGAHISMDHPIVKKGLALGLTAYGSPTTSNQSVCQFTTIKIGPGDSSRSHTADEYILRSEVEQGIEIYTALLDGLQL
jgi:acetylornithine deacetylase